MFFFFCIHFYFTKIKNKYIRIRVFFQLSLNKKKFEKMSLHKISRCIEVNFREQGVNLV